MEVGSLEREIFRQNLGKENPLVRIRGVFTGCRTNIFCKIVHLKIFVDTASVKAIQHYVNCNAQAFV